MTSGVSLVLRRWLLPELSEGSVEVFDNINIAILGTVPRVPAAVDSSECVSVGACVISLGTSILLETQKILSNRYADLEVIVVHREKVLLRMEKEIATHSDKPISAASTALNLYRLKSVCYYYVCFYIYL